jgi:hypothetical protein
MHGESLRSMSVFVKRAIQSPTDLHQLGYRDSECIPEVHPGGAVS